MGTTTDQSWQDEIRIAFRDPIALARHLNIPLGRLPGLPPGSHFPLLVPRGFAAKMTKGDPLDPLLLQVWPNALEAVALDRERVDPVGDLSARKAPGLLQKYAGRALVVTTGACAVHCRYCFRQNFPYDEAARSQEQWQLQLDVLRSDTSLHEVVLSGGDPLTLQDSVLAQRLADLETIPHLKTLRIHTRLPVVIPSRATGRLCQILAQSRLRKVMVIHSNHPAEIDGEVASGLAKFASVGVTLLNQSVLLAGINDDVSVLEQLSHKLWNAGVLPYYLHALDRVQGSARFSVPDPVGIGLIEALRTRLPGYLAPRLVREIEGAESKTPMG